MGANEYLRKVGKGNIEYRPIVRQNFSDTTGSVPNVEPEAQPTLVEAQLLHIRNIIDKKIMDETIKEEKESIVTLYHKLQGEVDKAKAQQESPTGPVINTNSRFCQDYHTKKDHRDELYKAVCDFEKKMLELRQDDELKKELETLRRTSLIGTSWWKPISSLLGGPVNKKDWPLIAGVAGVARDGWDLLTSGLYLGRLPHKGYMYFFEEKVLEYKKRVDGQNKANADAAFIKELEINLCAQASIADHTALKLTDSLFKLLADELAAADPDAKAKYNEIFKKLSSDKTLGGAIEEINGDITNLYEDEDKVKDTLKKYGYEFDDKAVQAKKVDLIAKLEAVKNKLKDKVGMREFLINNLPDNINNSEARQEFTAANAEALLSDEQNRKAALKASLKKQLGRDNPSLSNLVEAKNLLAHVNGLDKKNYKDWQREAVAEILVGESDYDYKSLFADDETEITQYIEQLHGNGNGGETENLRKLKKLNAIYTAADDDAGDAVTAAAALKERLRVILPGGEDEVDAGWKTVLYTNVPNVEEQLLEDFKKNSLLTTLKEQQKQKEPEKEEQIAALNTLIHDLEILKKLKETKKELCKLFPAPAPAAGAGAGDDGVVAPPPSPDSGWQTELYQGAAEEQLLEDFTKGELTKKIAEKLGENTKIADALIEKKLKKEVTDSFDDIDDGDVILQNLYNGNLAKDLEAKQQEVPALEQPGAVELQEPGAETKRKRQEAVISQVKICEQEQNNLSPNLLELVKSAEAVIAKNLTKDNIKKSYQASNDYSAKLLGEGRPVKGSDHGYKICDNIVTSDNKATLRDPNWHVDADDAEAKKIYKLLTGQATDKKCSFRIDVWGGVENTKRMVALMKTFEAKGEGYRNLPKDIPAAALKEIKKQLKQNDKRLFNQALLHISQMDDSCFENGTLRPEGLAQLHEELGRAVFGGEAKKENGEEKKDWYKGDSSTSVYTKAARDQVLIALKKVSKQQAKKMREAVSEGLKPEDLKKYEDLLTKFQVNREKARNLDEYTKWDKKWGMEDGIQAQSSIGSGVNNQSESDSSGIEGVSSIKKMNTLERSLNWLSRSDHTSDIMQGASPKSP